MAASLLGLEMVYMQILSNSMSCFFNESNGEKVSPNSTFCFVFSFLLVFVILFPMLLLSPEPIWDDWIAYGLSGDERYQVFKQAGAPWVSAIFNAVDYFGYWWSRFSVVICYSVAAGFFSLILVRLIGVWPAIYSSLFFAVMPFNESRFFLILLPYALSTMFFYGGIFVILFHFSYLSVSRWKAFCFLVFGVVCLFLSFTTQSYLVWLYFFMAPFFLWALNGSNHRAYVLSVFSFVCILPFLFFWIKNHFFMPYGNYDGYNSISFSVFDVLGFFGVFSNGFYSNLIGFGGEQSVGAGSLWLFVSVVMIVFVFVCLSVKFVFFSSVKNRLNFFLLSFCLAGCVVALFPYWVAGVVPEFQHWNTRHFLIFQSSYSLLFVFCLYQVKNCFIRNAFFILSCLLLFFFWVDFSSRVNVHEMKQRQIISAISDLLPPSGGRVLFDDRLEYLSIWGIAFNTNELNSLLVVGTFSERFCGVRLGPSAWMDDLYVAKNSEEIFSICNAKGVYVNMGDFNAEGPVFKLSIYREGVLNYPDFFERLRILSNDEYRSSFLESFKFELIEISLK